MHIKLFALWAFVSVVGVFGCLVAGIFAMSFPRIEPAIFAVISKVMPFAMLSLTACAFTVVAILIYIV